MRRPLRYLVVALVATAALVGVGLAVLGATGSGDGQTGASGSGSGASGSASAEPFRSVALSAYDASSAVIQRASFCSRIDPRQVTSTLGGPAISQRSWGDGDRTTLAVGLTDVAHEFGCEYDGAAGVTARAWVFAPPVGRAQAATWAKATADSSADGTCATTTATFGSPSTLLACQTAQQRSATYRGLFGDAWLSCEVVAPLTTTAAALADQAGRWCVGVARAAAAR